jgi:hypothetical protein
LPRQFARNSRGLPDVFQPGGNQPQEVIVMLLKTATSLAFATACLTAVANLPANAQMARTAGAGPGYQSQGTTAPNWSQGNYGTTRPGTAAPNWSQDNYGSTAGNSTAQPNPGNMPASSAGMGGNEVISNSPQGTTPPDWSAQQNVRQSERYDRLLESNRAFRQARIRRECGPITDPDLHQQCLASFNQDEPYAGSSTSHRTYRSESGR